MMTGPESVEDGGAIVTEKIGIVALMGRRPGPWCVRWHIYMLATRRGRKGEDSEGLREEEGQQAPQGLSGRGNSVSAVPCIPEWLVIARRRPRAAGSQ